MAWKEYLKTAANQLRRGSSALTDEVHQLRKTHDDIARQGQEQIRQFEHQIHEFRAASSRPETSPEDRIMIEREAAALSLKISDTKRDVQKNQQIINDQIRAIEGQQRSLEQQAGNIEKQAG